MKHIENLLDNVIAAIPAVVLCVLAAAAASAAGYTILTKIIILTVWLAIAGFNVVAISAIVWDAIKTRRQA